MKKEIYFSKNDSMNKLKFMRIDNFINEDERSELEKFYYENIHDKNTLIMDGVGNLTTDREKIEKSICLYSILKKSELTKEIDDRIIKYFGLENFKREGKKGTDGSWAMMMFPGHELRAHTDPIDEIKDDEEIIRCNILINKPEKGGMLYEYNDKNQCTNIKINERSLIFFEVTSQPHGVSMVRGNDPRIIMLLSTVAPKGTAEKIIEGMKCFN